jgi:hypothetical protein
MRFFVLPHRHIGHIGGHIEYSYVIPPDNYREAIGTIISMW